MPKSLSGVLISDWYTSLLHVSGSEIIPNTQNPVYDGAGNETTLSVALCGGGITINGALSAGGFVGVSDNLTSSQIKAAVDIVYPINTVYLTTETEHPSATFVDTIWSLMDCDLCPQYATTITPGTSGITTNLCYPGGLDVIFTVDDSGSMKGDIDFLKIELDNIINKLTDNNTIPNVRIGLLTFKNQREPTTRLALEPMPPCGDWTSRWKNLLKASGGLKEYGADAIYEAVDQLTTEPPSEETVCGGIRGVASINSSSVKIIIHVTDEPTATGTGIPTLTEAANYALSKGVTVFPIDYANKIGSTIASSFRSGSTAARRKQTQTELKDLASITGGLYFAGNNTTAEFVNIMEEINLQACPNTAGKPLLGAPGASTTTATKLIYTWKRVS